MKTLQPIGTKDALLDALTEHYTNYRKLVEFNTDEKEFIKCKLALEAILKELNTRKEKEAGLTTQNDDNVMLIT